MMRRKLLPASVRPAARDALENSKSEFRNPKQIRTPNAQNQTLALWLGGLSFLPLGEFELASDFEICVSSLDPHPSYEDSAAASG
jgi:hypothetical protein